MGASYQTLGQKILPGISTDFLEDFNIPKEDLEYFMGGTKCLWNA
jgi:hypothetical protein